MPRPCTVCTHPERAAIDQALVAGEAPFALARRYSSLSEPALRRHKGEHLPATLAKAQAAAEVAHADDLLGQVRGLRDKALGILTKAEEAGDLKTALLAIREARATLELLGEMEGELSRQPAVNLLVAPEYVAVRTRLLAALLPYPEARIVAAEALRAGE